MEAPLVTMNPVAARQAWNQYRAAIKKRHTKEDEILLRGYKHLAQGKKILDLFEVMKSVGLDGNGRPRLAIARANWEKCWLDIFENGEIHFQLDRWARGSRQRIIIPPGIISGRFTRQFNLTARTPAVPPQFKPAGSLDNYHIMWDAKWDTEPPRDPILLRHLGRNVYAVLATWDLTALERALLR